MLASLGLRLTFPKQNYASSDHFEALLERFKAMYGEFSVCFSGTLALFGCLEPGVSQPLPAVSHRRAARSRRGCRRTSGALQRLRARRQPAGGAPAPARPREPSFPKPGFESVFKPV